MRFFHKDANNGSCRMKMSNVLETIKFQQFFFFHLSKNVFFNVHSFLRKTYPNSPIIMSKLPAHHKNIETVFASKWLKLTKITYVDETKVERVSLIFFP